MILEITKDYIPLAQQALHVVFGEMHRTMLFIYLVGLFNLVSVLFKSKRRGEELKDYAEKMFGYTAFIALGNIVDQLMMDHMTDLQGTCQKLVCLYLVVRELNVLKDYLSETHGIQIPILEQHLGKLESKNRSPEEKKEEMNANIESLNKKLDSLEKNKKGDT